MPKTFTDSERAYIKHRLMDEAKVCLSKFGVRKTTVDELVKRVNIPKGTFYLFYKSKELLFFDVFCVFHDEIQSELINQIDAMNKEVTTDKVTELIFELYKKVEASFLFPFMTNGDMELLMRKLPPEIVKDHVQKDDLSIEQFRTMLPSMKTEDIKIFSAVFRAIFLSMLHKHEIGEDTFDDALKIMIHGIVIQMFKGDAL